MSYIGTTKIGKMFLGTVEIAKAYLGTNLVFQKSGSNAPVYVDYIETDGTAYINTGKKGTAPMSCEATITPLAVSSSVFGCRKDSGDTRLVFIVLFSDKKVGYSFASGTYNPLDISDSIDNRTPMTVKTKLVSRGQQIQIKQHGESSWTSYSSSIRANITTERDIYLFCINDQGTPSTVQNGLRFGEVKLYSDANWTNLVWHGKPCYYNGEYGMFDVVSNTFFGNVAGSGAFTGPQI